MRKLGLVFATVVLAACGTDPMTGGDDDGMGSGSGSGSGSGEQPAFSIRSKDVMLNPGQEVTYCYYFHTPNTEEILVKKWTSEMTPGSHHMIMFYGNANQPADGTLDPSGSCGGIGGGSLSVPIWVYASQTPTGHLDMPQDDGTGKPLAMSVEPNQPAYFQMHYLNSTDGPLTVHVELNAFAYEAGVETTPTAAFITYNAQISIPNGSTDFPISQTCNLPAGVKFWTVSTHSHKQSVQTELLDGASSIFLSKGPDAWEHPGAKTWDAMPFYTFASGKMTYTCTYTNNTGRTITDGPSAQTDEMCMGTGYMFPADKAKFCYTATGPL